MSNDPERDEAPSYEGEVVDEKARMRPRTKVALVALGTTGVLAATGNWWPVITLICLYVTWMFVRTWLAKQRRDRTWRLGGGTIERGGML